MVFDKPITIEKLNSDTDEYEKEFQLHAKVNKTSAKNFSENGAERTGMSLTFEVRYFLALEQIFGNFQNFRIIYRNKVFYINDYDDYMESHKTVKLTGVANG